MHAFLLVGQEITNYELQITNLSKKLDAKILEFPIQKIDDTRELNKLLRLSFNEKTLIVVRDIHNATEEALNAFLKNLEEPQEQIYFALTAPSERTVLSTIVSRCQIIKITNDKLQITNETMVEQEKFMNLTKGEQLSYIDKIKDRNIAIKFINDLIYYLYNKKELNNMETLLTTLNNIKKNGNVSLHLTNLVARMEDAHG